MSKRLFVGGLPYDMTEEKMQEVFSECGRVEKVKIMIDRGSGRSKGFGFVEMATDLEGKAAILKFDNAQLGPRKISVKEARPAEDRHKPAGGHRPARENQDRGRQPQGHQPREKRFSNRSENRGNGEAPRQENHFGESRPPRNNGYGDRPPRANKGFAEESRPNGFSRPNAPAQGEQAGSGEDFNRKPHGRGPAEMRGNNDGNRSDWRTELGIGTGQPQRRAPRRNDHQRDTRRFRGPMDDNFGNR